MPLSAHALVGFNNLLTTATLSASVSALLPLSNLQDPIHSIRTRLNGTTVTITADLGGAQSVQAMALYNTNCTPTATIDGRYSSDNFASENVLVGSLTVGAHIGINTYNQFPLPLFLTDAVSRRYWRWVITDPNNTSGYLDIGLGWLSSVVQFNRNVAANIAIGMLDDTTIQRTTLGAAHRIIGARRRGVTVRFDELSEVEALVTLFDQLHIVGMGTDCLLCVAPLHADAAVRMRSAFYGRFVNLGEQTPLGDAPRWSATALEFEES